MWTVNYVLLKPFIALMRIPTFMEASEVFNATSRMHLHTQMLNQGELPGCFKELLSHPAQNTNHNPALLTWEQWGRRCVGTSTPQHPVAPCRHGMPQRNT